MALVDTIHCVSYRPHLHVLLSQILHTIDYTHTAAAEGRRSLILQCVINVSYCLAAGCRRHQGMEANIDTAARTIVRSVVSIQELEKRPSEGL